MFKQPQIAATLNITPDSFSDGGKNFDIENATKTLVHFIEQEVDIIDIGAESTRPNLTHNTTQKLGTIQTIGHEQEWARLESIIPIAVQMSAGTKTKISLDSRNYETFKKALDLGIDILNDVSCLADDRTIALLREYKKDIILMHNLGIPANPDILIDHNLNPVEFIIQRLRKIVAKLKENGVRDDQIILDPGIGFGQDANQAVEILHNIGEFKKLGHKVLVGHSRKSFFNLITDLPYKDRDLETHILSIFLAQNNVDIIRVHDVVGTKRALACAKLFF